MGEREVRRSPSRRLGALVALTTVALATAGPASAATPQEIYRDVVDNGRVDGRYTPAELRRAFNLRQVLGTDARQPAAAQQAPARPDAPTATQPARGERRRVPFSGFDVALLVAGGGPLLLIGAGLRRRLAPPPRQAPVASA